MVLYGGTGLQRPAYSRGGRVRRALLLGLLPKLRLPSVVFEIVAGIAIGPSVLGWVEVDQTIEVLALIGLAYLLFLAGLEIDFGELRGRLLRLAALGWVISFAIAVAVGFGLELAGLVNTPLLVAIILSRPRRSA